MVFALIVAIISTSTVTAIPKQIGKYIIYDVGDVNYDGKVNSLDYGYLRAYLLGMEEAEFVEERLREADVNGDGVINSIDFAHFRIKLLEGTEFPKVLRMVNTTITLVDKEPLYLVAQSPFAQFEISVILRDEAGNPLKGKMVHFKLAEYSNSQNPVETDENGRATYSFRQPHTDQVPFRTYEAEIPIYFIGDEEYNGCEYIAKAIMSNNGGPQRTTAPSTPVPTPAPTPR